MTVNASFGLHMLVLVQGAVNEGVKPRQARSFAVQLGNVLGGKVGRLRASTFRTKDAIRV